MKNYKKIIILSILFVAVAGFALAPASAAKTYKEVTKMDMWHNEDVEKNTKKYVVFVWKSKGTGGYNINKIYEKVNKAKTKKDYWGSAYVFTPKLKKTQYGGRIKVISETYKFTIKKRDSMKTVKTYTRTVKPTKKLYLKLPNHTWISNIKVTSKYKYKY